MNYSVQEIANIFEQESNRLIEYKICEVSIDSRRMISPAQTLFFALRGEMNDGHHFIEDAYNKGVRNFVVHKDFDQRNLEKANFFKVDRVLQALQKLATHHRKSHSQLKKIGITGSNGKTVVKEWLYQMLYDKYKIVKSPKSYNSQIGMALSLLGIEENHELGIIEAGISRKNEMINHLEMLHPNIGMITNLGSAHDEGFESRKEKLEEKMILFRNVSELIYCKDHTSIDDYVTKTYSDKSLLTWGHSNHSELRVLSNQVHHTIRSITLKYKDEQFNVRLVYTDSASFENCMHCIALMLLLGISPSEIEKRISRISGLHMRLEMSSGIYQSIIVNDAYSADLDSLDVALEFIRQQSGQRKKVAILSTFEQSGKEEIDVLQNIVDRLIKHGFEKLYYLSDRQFDKTDFDLNVEIFTTKENLLTSLQPEDIQNKIILIKGARKYGLEALSDRLKALGHSATLHINLSAIEHNLRTYKKRLNQGVGIIAVVKASAYGSGSVEVAKVLEQNGIQILAVAFTDEGINLRHGGIGTQIMVFNPDLTSLPDIVRYGLEPEVYSFDQLQQIVNYSIQNKVDIGIHLKVDTGMHRLGFLKDDLDDVCLILKNSDYVTVKTIFSHLASSEDEKDDAYTHLQFSQFDRMYEQISRELDYSPKRHILNSGGISRFADHQFDYVRLGVGMYGIDNNVQILKNLRRVHMLNASLIQVKNLKKGDSVGYNRKTILDKDSAVGIVNIGYADGVMRCLGNRNYHYFIGGKEAPILGNVCMDVTIVDLSNLPTAKVGDHVEIFGNSNKIEDLSKAAGTIPYEILSRISSRVQRKFVRE